MNKLDQEHVAQFINAVKEGLTEDVERMLQEQPDLLHVIDADGETPLMAAVYYGKQHIVQQLLTYGVAVSLHEAVAIGDLEAVEYLVLEASVSPTSYSYDGWTPLHLAAFFGHLEVAQFLLTQEVDVNMLSTNPQNNAPIHAATAGRKLPLVQLLLEHGANPNLKQSKGWTPLLQAVHNFDLTLCDLLLEHGADATIANDDGVTALAYAEQQGYDDLVQRLTAL